MSHVFLYLDESGCLGFDSSGASKFFVVTLLKIEGIETQKKISRAILRTLKSKISAKEKKNHYELKGSKTDLSIKQYFYRHMPTSDWSIFTVILNKEHVYHHLKAADSKKRLYNYIAKFLLSHVNLSHNVTRLDLVMDRCKSSREIKDFNTYIEAHLDLSPNALLNISHVVSHESPAIQAVDLFCWGIARKYTLGETSWYDCFKKKIEFESVYLPDQNKKRRTL